MNKEKTKIFVRYWNKRNRTLSELDRVGDLKVPKKMSTLMKRINYIRELQKELQQLDKEGHKNGLC